MSVATRNERSTRGRTATDQALTAIETLLAESGRAALLRREALALGPSAGAEKDLCVAKALGAVETFNASHVQLALDGGTCLSACHRLLRRSSEDIDLRIRPLGERRRGVRPPWH